MLKKTITFEDLDGNEITEDFYFNLSKAELIEMELSAEGGLRESLQRLIKTRDGAKIIAEFKRIVLASYGVRSEDNRRFIKNDQLREEFAATDAYSKLFMELALDDGAAATFINAVIPSDLGEEVARVTSGAVTVELPQEEEPRKFEDYTEAELLEMSQEDFEKLVGRDTKKWSREQLAVAFARKSR